MFRIFKKSILKEKSTRQLIFRGFSSKKAAGFSLIELIMVVAIFIVISGIVLSKQSKFSSDVLISNVAYQVALSIREAQVYGIGSRQKIIETGGSFVKLPYGINIKPNTPTLNNPIGKPTSYILFADVDDPTTNGTPYFYDAGIDKIAGTGSLPQGQKINRFCGKSLDAEWICWIGGDSPLSELNIVFIRPNPDPIIRGSNFSGQVEAFSDAIIVVESSIGDKCRKIKVTSTGQITVASTTAGITGCTVYSSD